MSNESIPTEPLPLSDHQKQKSEQRAPSLRGMSDAEIDHAAAAAKRLNATDRQNFEARRQEQARARSPKTGPAARF